MTVSADMIATWRRPRQVLRAKLGQGERDDRALAILLGACFLLFIAQWPMHARAAHFDPSVPLQARIGGALMATIFILPLVFYAVAVVSHWIARAFGGKGSHYGARLALFWALLCTAPLMLLQGLVAGFIGPGPQLALVTVLIGLAFFWLWLTLLHEAELG